MRILHSIVIDGWPAGSWYAVNMARQLQDMGHETLFVCRPNCRTQREAEDAGVPTFTKLNLKKKMPWKMVWNLSYIGHLLTTWKPDIICAHWGEDHSAWGMIKAMYGDKTPLVRVRSLDPKPPKAHPLGKWLHEQVTDLVITSNKYLRWCYLERFALRGEQVQVVYPGLDLPDQSPFLPSPDGYKAENPVVGLLARFSPVKGHRFFFPAARMVADRIDNVRFVLAGFASELTREDIQQMAAEDGIADRVDIISERTGGSTGIIRQFDVGVISSVFSESISRALMEYLGMGIPAVATYVGGIPDLMGEGDFGIVVSPEDPSAMAAAIINMLQDHARRHRCGHAAREFMRTQRTWPQAAGKFQDALLRLQRIG